MSEKPRTLRDVLMGPTLPVVPESALDRLQALGEQLKPAWMQAIEGVKLPSILDSTKLPHFAAEIERRLDEPLHAVTPPVSKGAKVGRPRSKREPIKPKIRADIEAGKDLTTQHESWATNYGVDRTTFVAARDEVLREMGRSVPRKRTRIPRTK